MYVCPLDKVYKKTSGSYILAKLPCFKLIKNEKSIFGTFVPEEYWRKWRQFVEHLPDNSNGMIKISVLGGGSGFRNYPRVAVNTWSVHEEIFFNFECCCNEISNYFSFVSWYMKWGKKLNCV